jgi:N,N'-diacetylchitobiose transport system permease protein
VAQFEGAVAASAPSGAQPALPGAGSPLAPPRAAKGPSVPVSTPRGRRSRRATAWAGGRRLLPLVMLLPALVLVGGVLGYPIGQLVATSFQQLGLFQLIGHHVVWNGLANYKALLSSSQFGDSLEQTALFVAACVSLTMLVGTGAALLMKRLGKPMRTAMSFAMLLAWAMPTSASSIVWSWLFETQWGVANYLLTSLGFRSANHDWFAGSLSAYGVITAMIVWGAVPFVALTMYSAFTLVPHQLVEAAAVDGASPGTVFRRVTMPIVRPIFVLLVVLSVIWDGNVFNQVWFLTGGRAQVINVIPLGVWQYIEAFSSEQYGLGAAVAVVTVLILLAVTGYYIRIMVRTGEA